MPTLSRSALRELALAGVKAKVEEMERQLAIYHHEWPELFLSQTPPQLLAATLKTSSNGSAPEPPWPPIVVGKQTPRLSARSRSVIGAVASFPAGVTIDGLLSTSLRSMARRQLIGTLTRLVNLGQIERRGRATYGPVTGGTVAPQRPVKPRKVQPQKTSAGWTPAMRKRAARQMRARWKADPEKMAANLARARTAKGGAR